MTCMYNITRALTLQYVLILYNITTALPHGEQSEITFEMARAVVRASIKLCNIYMNCWINLY